MTTACGPDQKPKSVRVRAPHSTLIYESLPAAAQVSLASLARSRGAGGCEFAITAHFVDCMSVRYLIARSANRRAAAVGLTAVPSVRPSPLSLSPSEFIASLPSHDVNLSAAAVATAANAIRRKKL